MSDKIPMDKLAAIYIKIRNRMAELTKAYDTEIEGLKDQQEKIKFALKDFMQDAGLSSLKTDRGTVSLTKKTRYQTQDWDEFKKFLLEHDALDLLERRIAQGNMAQFLEENPTLLPPGLNAHTEYDVSVRKPT